MSIGPPLPLGDDRRQTKGQRKRRQSAGITPGIDRYHRPTTAGARQEGSVEERRDGRPPITIEGSLIALGPLRRELIPTYHRWHNDVATLRTYLLPLPATREEQEALYAELTAASDIVFFTIYEQSTWRAVGMT